MSTIETATRRPPTRALVLLLVLTWIPLGWLLYDKFGRALTPSGGMSIVLINETRGPMLEAKFAYPGGDIAIGRLDAGRSVGNPVRYPGECEGTLTYKDEGGKPHEVKVKLRPIDELLIVLYVQPVLEDATVTTADGTQEPVLLASTEKVRVLVSYMGEDTKI